MRIILEKDGVKREIISQFNICGSFEDLQKLHRELAIIINRMESAEIAYGWFTVHDDPVRMAAGLPREWTE